MATRSPFVGPHPCVVEDVRLLDIHGTRYYAFLLALASDPRPMLEAGVPARRPARPRR